MMQALFVDDSGGAQMSNSTHVQAVLLDELGAPQGPAGRAEGYCGSSERGSQGYVGVRAVMHAGVVLWEAFLPLSADEHTDRVLGGFASARLAARAFDVLLIQELERQLRAVSGREAIAQRAQLETSARSMCNFPEDLDATRDILHVTEVQQPGGARVPAFRPCDSAGPSTYSSDGNETRKIVGCFRAVLNGESSPNALFWDILGQVVQRGTVEYLRQICDKYVQSPEQRELFLNYLDEGVLNDRFPADKVNVIMKFLSQSSAPQSEGGRRMVDEGDRSLATCQAGENSMMIDVEGQRRPDAHTSKVLTAVCNVYHVVADDATQGEGEGGGEGEGEARVASADVVHGVRAEAVAMDCEHEDLADDGDARRDAAVRRPSFAEIPARAQGQLEGDPIPIRSEAQHDATLVTGGGGRAGAMEDGTGAQKEAPADREAAPHADLGGQGPNAGAAAAEAAPSFVQGPGAQEDETARTGTSGGGTGSRVVDRVVEERMAGSQEDDCCAEEGRSDRHEDRHVEEENGPDDPEACAEVGKREGAKREGGQREHGDVTEGDVPVAAKVQGSVVVRIAGAEPVEGTGATVQGNTPSVSAEVCEVKGKMETETVTNAEDAVATMVKTAGQGTVEASWTSLASFDSPCAEGDRLAATTEEGTVEEGAGRSTAETNTVFGKTEDGTARGPLLTPLQTTEETGRAERVIACKREEGMIQAKEEQCGPGGQERAKLAARQRKAEKQKKKADMMARFLSLKTELEEAFKSGNANMDEDGAGRGMKTLESMATLVLECSSELDLMQTKWRLMQRDATKGIADVRMQEARTAATTALALKTHIQTLTLQYISVCEQYTQALQQMCDSGDGEEGVDGADAGADARADALCEEKRRLQTLLTEVFYVYIPILHTLSHTQRERERERDAHISYTLYLYIYVVYLSSIYIEYIRYGCVCLCVSVCVSVCVCVRETRR